MFFIISGESEYEKQNSLNANRIIELTNEDDEAVPTLESEQNGTTERFSKNSAGTCDNEFLTNIEEPLGKRKHTLITFEKEDPPKKKPSILDRLGKKTDEVKKTRISVSEFRKEEERFMRFSKHKDRAHDREERDRSSRITRTRRERSRSRSSDRGRNISNKRDTFRSARSEVRRSETKVNLLSFCYLAMHISV